MQLAHSISANSPTDVARHFEPSRLPYRLGDILLADRSIDKTTLRRALELKHQSAAPLGEILLENGWINDQALMKGLAQQWQLETVDLAQKPPDLELLIDLDCRDCMKFGCIPWCLSDGSPIIALSDPTLGKAARAACGLDGHEVTFVIATRADVLTCLEKIFAQELEQDARCTCHADLSARSWNKIKAATFGGLVVCATASIAWINPVAIFWILFSWILCWNVATAAFRTIAACARFWPEEDRADRRIGAVRLSDHRTLPKVTLMIGLLRETHVLPSLLKHLANLQYPREKLQVMFLLEQDDEVTLKHLSSIDPERAFDVVIVPKGTLMTKPRALNYGLNFANGDIVGVLDAEDRPHPEQIQAMVEHLHTAPPDVACVQGLLEFYNDQRNWLSRCFAIEYAIWFNVLLRGFRRLKIPIPLGGTTVYFRRHILEKMGAWDAHNVTEDADLGMRLCRYGYRTEVMSSVTYEEANARVFPWIRQRSRWIKGYVMTWAIHMKRPCALLHDLGLRGFLAFQLIFLGGITSYLSIPLLWAMWFGLLGGDLQARFGAPDILWQLAFASMIFGQIVMISVSLSALLVKGKRHLIPWVFTLPLYWPIGALAALKAIAEVFFAPYYWDKTEHGLQSDQTTLNVTSPSAPIESA